MDVMFSYYEGNIFKTDSLGTVGLSRFIHAHKNPKPFIMNLFKKIEEANKSNDNALKRALKQKLFSFTPSVIIPKGKSRSYKSIKEWTILMQLDFDGMSSVDEATDLKHTLFFNYPIAAAYLSPSRLGVKALMKITKPKNLEHYKAIHKAVSKEMEMFSYFDDATNNAVLPLFLSYDFNILYRDINKLDAWTNEDWSKPKYVRLNNKPPITYSNSDYNLNRTKKIFINKIRNIFDNGHPQLRSACLVLGSRVGANYISENEAIQIAFSEIDNNNYLSKNIAGYKATAKWCIQEGIKNPKYY